jgi:hypothetical protein
MRRVSARTPPTQSVPSSYLASVPRRRSESKARVSRACTAAGVLACGVSPASGELVCWAELLVAAKTRLQQEVAMAALAVDASEHIVEPGDLRIRLPFGGHQIATQLIQLIIREETPLK